MSWVITPSNLLVDDQDALTYLAAVETADGQALESGVRLAVNAFVKGCKADGIWPAIKASCILAGARTLSGALVPLVGAAPTNVGGLFVSGDYNRKTGLVGDGTKYLNSNRANNADPESSQHLAAYQTFRGGGSTAVMGSDNVNGRSVLFQGGNFNQMSVGSRGITIGSNVDCVGTNPFLCGISRSSSTSFVFRGFSTTTVTLTSLTPSSGNIEVFSYAGGSNKSSSRIAFYSIGESLDLAKLDARVTTLINAFDAAI
jgi:hypothetical protein